MVEKEAEEVQEQDDNNLELTRQEIDIAKTNYDYYSKSKGSQIELFELPMLLTACGLQVLPSQI